MFGGEHVRIRSQSLNGFGTGRLREESQGLLLSFLTFLRPIFLLASLALFPPPLTAPGSPRMISLLECEICSKQDDAAEKMRLQTGTYIKSVFKSYLPKIETCLILQKIILDKNSTVKKRSETFSCLNKTVSSQ